MTVEEIKKALKREAIIFHTGGFRPTNEISESWIGKVGWKLKNEEIPMDDNQQEMLPVATIFLPDSPACPSALSGIKLITIFVSNDLFKHLDSDDLSPWFVIRTYKSLDDLVPCCYISKAIKPFPLSAELVENDFPTWDNGGIPDDIDQEICTLEEQGDLDYFEDIYEENYHFHKIGGYPSFCQSGIWYGDDYPFVLQISSDFKADFNIIDSGNFYFYYNAEEQDWKVHCDFY